MGSSLMVLFILEWCLLLASGVTLEDQFMTISRQKRYLTIPTGSAIGILIAFAIPADLKQNILLSWNMEANYNVPDQTYYFGTPPSWPDLNQDGDLPDATRRTLRSLTRHHAYVSLQNRLDSLGLNGEACLLKFICEISQTTLEHNGLVGQLLSILLRPSSSLEEKLSSSFVEAEKHGVEGSSCFHVYKKCPKSIFDLISATELF